MAEKIVIIGGGIAGLSAAQAAREANSEARIHLICGDTIAPEADQVAAVAVQKGVSFKNVYQAAIASYWQKQKQTE